MKKLLCLSLCFLQFVSTAQNTVCFEVLPNPYASTPGLDVFTKYITVFGVNIFATAAVSDEKVKHCAAVMAEYLDNNEDGTIDNELVTNKMSDENASMVLFEADGSASQNTFFNDYNGDWQLQDLYGEEIHEGGSSNANGFDATLEEVLHLITHVGYAGVYPNVWGESAGTQVANAMDTARGGQFTTIPNNYPANAWYHYDDATCEYNCMVTEYVYWSLTTLLGAQNYTGRCAEIANEWELCTATNFTTTDTLMYNLLVDPIYQLPTALPDGNYCPQTNEVPLLKESGAVLYPNPATTVLNLKHETINPIIGAIIVNAQGKELLNFSNKKGVTSMDITSLDKGMYYVRLFSETGSVTHVFQK